MPDAKPDARDIAGYRRLYDKADSFGREVADFRSEVSIPVHNQLRYAGHHLLQSIDDNGTVADADQLADAKGHCKRAMYEAAEAGIIHALREMEDFRDEFRDIVVKDVVDNYLDMLVQSEAARDLIITGRAGRESVESQTAEFMESFRALTHTLRTLDAARDDLNAKKRALVRENRRFWITVIGIIGTVAIAVSSFI